MNEGCLELQKGESEGDGMGRGRIRLIWSGSFGEGGKKGCEYLPGKEEVDKILDFRDSILVGFNLAFLSTNKVFLRNGEYMTDDFAFDWIRQRSRISRISSRMGKNEKSVRITGLGKLFLKLR